MWYAPLTVFNARVAWAKQVLEGTGSGPEIAYQQPRQSGPAARGQPHAAGVADARDWPSVTAAEDAAVIRSHLAQGGPFDDRSLTVQRSTSISPHCKMHTSATRQ